MLTDTAVKNAKPKRKDYKLSDSHGLYLLVTTSGGKLWRRNYRFAGRQQTYSFGVYDAITLKDARELNQEVDKFLARSIDPNAVKKEKKQALVEQEREAANTFARIAAEWDATSLRTLSVAHAKRIRRYLEKHILPAIGNRVVNTLVPQDFLSIVKPLEETAETAHKVLNVCRQVMAYARTAGLIPYNTASELSRNIRPVKTKHRAAVTEPDKIAQLLVDIDAYKGHPIVRLYLKIIPLVFVRPGELRLAEWDEFDFENALWRIPAERMKMKGEHDVPLSRQVIELLRELQEVPGTDQYLFPAIQRSKELTMSNMSALKALRIMGYNSETMSIHGFRGMASTRLNEMCRWPEKVIEAALSHAEQNKVRAAYNRAGYLKERREMLQAWADYLDELRTKATVAR